VKIPLIIRDDGTAYRLTLHEDHPPFPELGTEENGFVLHSVSTAPVGNMETNWLLHEEFRKPAEADLLAGYAHVVRERDDLAEWKRQYLEVEHWWQEVDDYIRKLPSEFTLGQSIAKIALRMLKERDALKEQYASYRTGTHYPNEPLPDIQWDGPKEREELARLAADYLDTQPSQILEVRRPTFVRIWKALLRK